jgi:hypothetical protein
MTIAASNKMMLLPQTLLIPLLLQLSSATNIKAAFLHPPSRHPSRQSLQLNSLKPAAIPLMDSGKALARSGELLIDLTQSLQLYGGSLSASGACIRNCGDCLAQAAASCRFKTAVELVIDELREGADCLREGTDKLYRAKEESAVDNNTILVQKIEKMIDPMKHAAMSLEDGGKSILQKQSVAQTGDCLISCGEALEGLSLAIQSLDDTLEEARLSSQRMGYASQQMILAGKELRNDKKEAVKGKAWLKG